MSDESDRDQSGKDSKKKATRNWADGKVNAKAINALDRSEQVSEAQQIELWKQQFLGDDEEDIMEKEI